MDPQKKLAVNAVQDRSTHWVELSDRIHANPEYNFQEVKASRWLSEEFTRLGFRTELGVGGIPTAFKATLKGDQPGPTVGIIIEYDALESMGHACGHNTKGPAVLCGLEAFLKTNPSFRGSIVGFGCPAEEGGGGKVLMAEAGVFQGPDVCLELAVGPDFATGTRLYAIQGLDLSFLGKSAHAGLRHLKGINALEPLIFVLSNLEYLRKNIGDLGLIHGVVHEGGKSAAVIPDNAVAAINVRAVNKAILEQYVGYIEDLSRMAAGASGAKLQFKKGLMYLDYLKCPTLTHLVKSNFDEFGVDAEYLLDSAPRGSSDVGNVSHIIPTESIYVGLGHGLVPHTDGFREAAGGEPGHNVVVNGGKLLAMNLVDLLVKDSAEIISQAKAEHDSAGR